MSEFKDFTLRLFADNTFHLIYDGLILANVDTCDTLQLDWNTVATGPLGRSIKNKTWMIEYVRTEESTEKFYES